MRSGPPHLYRVPSVFAAIIALALIQGCSHTPSSTAPPTGSTLLQEPAKVSAENKLFLSEKQYNPWILSSTDSNRSIDPYLPIPGVGHIYGAGGTLTEQVFDGIYKNGVIVTKLTPETASIPAAGYVQSLDLAHGVLSTRAGDSLYTWLAAVGRETWAQFWSTSDIAIEGDPEAQQVTHANMFYLAGSAVGNQSIPPMGLSSDGYNGHIFWDAEIWMFPALVVQHPDLAYGIVSYRSRRLRQAEANAKADGCKGAEFPWESADTGKEEAPADFKAERHITADVAFSAWQYYLWTGDKDYLSEVAWPLMKDCADYWVSRATPDPAGKYHINGVIGPDELAGPVNDDAWTNAIVAESLRDTVFAAHDAGQTADPKWTAVADGLVLLKDPQQGFYIEHAGAGSSLMAKQADTQMLVYPLHVSMPAQTASSTLDYCLKHTIQVGPAMTDSINALIAARLGRAQQSLDLFHSSFRPFMRGPWDAFSEKRTKDNVYFCTGMGGCLQTVLYGFAGLNIVGPGQIGQGKLVARSGDAALYADPHLPPGWTAITVYGVRFRGHMYDVTAGPGSAVKVVQK